MPVFRVQGWAPCYNLRPCLGFRAWGNPGVGFIDGLPEAAARKSDGLNPKAYPNLSYHNSDWFLVGNGGMGYWDYYRGPCGTIIGIHSPIPY